MDQLVVICVHRLKMTAIKREGELSIQSAAIILYKPLIWDVEMLC